MRLGKRERAALKAKKAAVRLARIRARSAKSEGKYASAWGRIFHKGQLCLMPVGRPVVDWASGLTRGKRANTCPAGHD